MENQDRKIISLNLSPLEVENLKIEIREIQKTRIIKTANDVFSFAANIYKSLPLKVKFAIKELKSNSANKTVAAFMTGFPVDEPIGNDKNNKDSELILAGISYGLGKPFIAPNHRNSEIFLNLVPRKEDMGKQLGTGTELEWHSEDAQLSNPCNFICLLGLRGDRDARTLVSTIDPNQIDKDLLNSLLKENCIISSDSSYSKPYSEKTATVNFNNDGSFRLRYDPEFTTYSTVFDKITSSKLKKIFDENHESFTVDTGDLLIFNNYNCVHKRTKFDPIYSHKDRWIQRIMVI